MRKTLIILLTLAICICLVACGRKADNPKETGNNNSVSVEENGDSTSAGDEDNSNDEEKKSGQNNDKSAVNRAEEPSDDDMEIFNAYLDKIQSNEDEEKIQEELAEQFDMTPDEIKKAWLKVWEHKLEQAEQ